MDMAKHVRTTIRYDGPELSGHEMDVQDLAPALLALADIIQVANRKFNGDRAEIRVLVNADVEQKCFMIDLSLVQSLLDQAKVFFDSERVKTARDIAEWIGLIGGGLGVTGGGIWKAMQLLKGGDKPPLQVTTVGGLTTVITGSGNTVVLPSETFLLVQDKQIVDRAKTVLRPLQREGYTSLAFLQDDTEIVSITDEEAAAIIAAPSDEMVETPTEAVSVIQGPVRIKSPQYEGHAKWSLLWNGRAIEAEMVAQAGEWVGAFQSNKVEAPPNTVLMVTMTETARLDQIGMPVGKPSYVVSEVHHVMPPPRQRSLFGDIDS